MADEGEKKNSKLIQKERGKRNKHTNRQPVGDFQKL
jgi:hypothetical protein